MQKKYIICLIAAVVSVGVIFGVTKKVQAENNKDAYTLKINSDEKKFDVSDMLTGIFFEDINHGGDGGLYGELVENRSFEFKKSMDSWLLDKNGQSQGEVAIKKDSPLNSNNPTYVEINSTSEGDGLRLVNSGYKGININQGKKYYYSFWAKNVDGQCLLSVQVENNGGTVLSNVKTVDNIGKEWTKYEGELTANKDEKAVKLVIYTKGKGIVDLDMVSLFPQDIWKDRKYGLRKDLVERIDDLKPRFIRFPGGCVVEGHTQDQMYNWKNTIGKVEERKEIQNMWGYYQSYGLGFYEYFQLCEDVGAVPVPVVNCGMTCQGGVHGGRSKYMAKVGDELNTYIQDALDLIEYANGDETTTWGKKRIEAGHKEPFNLKYLAVGNEQWGNEYHKRFEEFQKVLNEKHPEITLISASGPIAEGALFDDAWKWIKSKADKTIVDEHYYMDPNWFLLNTERYNSYDRNGPKVFLGEYASQSNTLKSALSEAAYLTGLERNSDVVKMASYAPLLAKADSFQWKPDMVWFDGATNYATPDYYVQQLFGNNLGTEMLKDELLKPEVEKTSNEETNKVKVPDIFTSSSYDEKTGDLIVKVVNVTGEPKKVNVNINSSKKINSKASVDYITGDKDNIENSFDKPEEISIKNKTIDNASKDFQYMADKYSVSVIRLKFK